MDTFHVFRAFEIGIGDKNEHRFYPWQVLIRSGQSVYASVFSFSSQHAARMYPEPGMFVTTLKITEDSQLLLAK